MLISQDAQAKINAIRTDFPTNMLREFKARLHNASLSDEEFPLSGYPRHTKAQNIMEPISPDHLICGKGVYRTGTKYGYGTVDAANTC
jgi:hypothetical protein